MARFISEIALIWGIVHFFGDVHVTPLSNKQPVDGL